VFVPTFLLQDFQLFLGFSSQYIFYLFPC